VGALARLARRRGLTAAANVLAPAHSALPIPDAWPAPVVAAARVIGIADDRTEARKLIERQAKWQDHAWDYFDALGEVKYSGNFIGNALSKLILFPARRPAPGQQQPEPIEDAAPMDALARLEGPLGGHPEIMGAAGVHFSIPGECYLIGRELDPGDERWEIRAKDEVKRSAEGKVILIDGGDDKEKVELGEDSMLVRMWSPHRRRAWQADSPLRGVLSQCEELLILDRMARATERSRNNAGVLAVPNELRKVRRQVGTDASLVAEEGDLVDELLEALGTPVKDEGHANAIVPHLLFGEEKYLDKVRLIELSRTLDAWIDVRTERVQKRLAGGLNLPIEVVLGIGSANHWSAWAIDESAFKAHLEPLTLTILSSLTVGYLHPMLRAAGVPNWRDYIIWYDPVRLVARPNAVGDAKDLHDRGVIRDEDLRGAAGYDETSAPDEDEIQRRLIWRSSGRPSVAVDGAETPEQGPPEQEDSQASVTAAATREDPDLARLARRQADLDRQLYARLEAAFEAVLDQVLDRAGARVVQAANKGRGRTKGTAAASPAVQARVAAGALVKDVPRRQVIKTLGPAIVAQLGLQEEDLLRGAFDDLEDRFRAWVGQTQTAALGLVPDLTDAERRDAEREFERLLDDAWAWTRDALTDLARERLHDPDPRAPENGEHDATATVPFAIIREAVARAGGAVGPDAPVVSAAVLDPVKTALGLATGWLMQKLFRSKGIETEGWVWEYGPYPRTTEFEPHADLDGTEFVNFDDAVLANNEGWPRYAHYHPGDHETCRCSARPALVRVR